MSIEQIAGFFIFSFVAAATPGPNNVILTAAGASIGFKKGMVPLFGIVLGFSLMIFIVSISVGTILDYVLRYNTYIKFIGIILLLRLSWQIATSPTNNIDVSEVENKAKYRYRFIDTLLFQWVNPKAWIVIASAVTTYMNDELGTLSQSIIFASIFLITSTLGCLPWLLLGSSISHFLKNSLYAKIFNVSLSLLLIISVIPIMVI